MNNINKINILKMKENEDIVKNILNEEYYPNNLNGTIKGLIVNEQNISDLNNNQLIFGELSNKDKIFSTLKSFDDDNKLEEAEEAISLRN